LVLKNFVEQFVKQEGVFERKNLPYQMSKTKITDKTQLQRFLGILAPIPKH